MLPLFYFFQVLQALSVQGAPGSTGSSTPADLNSSGVSRAVIKERSVPWQFGLLLGIIMIEESLALRLQAFAMAGLKLSIRNLKNFMRSNLYGLYLIKNCVNP